MTGITLTDTIKTYLWGLYEFTGAGTNSITGHGCPIGIFTSYSDLTAGTATIPPHIIYNRVRFYFQLR